MQRNAQNAVRHELYFKIVPDIRLLGSPPDRKCLLLFGIVGFNKILDVDRLDSHCARDKRILVAKIGDRIIGRLGANCIVLKLSKIDLLWDDKRKGLFNAL